MGTEAAPRTLPTVLFVVVPAQMGGSNRSMVNLLQSLEGRVHRVVASPDFGAFREFVETNGLADELIDLPRKPGSAIDRLLRIGAGLKLAWWTLRRRSQVTAIHANGLTGLNMSTPASIVHKGAYVVWIHDPVGSMWGGRLGPIIRRLSPRLEIAAVSAVAEAVAVGNGLCATGDAHIVPNPIDPADVVGTHPVRSDGVVRIGVLGGATRRKGFDLIPETVERLNHADVSWNLYVSTFVEPGMEPIWETLKGFDEDRLKIHKKVVDVALVYSNLDIVFCPSRDESFCRVAAEAMINGIPVVASDLEPLRDLLGDEEAGLTFTKEDPESAAHALDRLVSQPELRQRMGATGIQRAQQFAPESIAKQMLALYGL